MRARQACAKISAPREGDIMTGTTERLPLPKEFDPLLPHIETYFRELPRLLAEGHAGKIALVRGNDVTVWDTTDDALQHAAIAFNFAQHLCQPIDARDIERLAPFMPPIQRESA